MTTSAAFFRTEIVPNQLVKAKNAAENDDLVTTW